MNYDGQFGGPYCIFLVNILLTVLTLGIHQFGAIARVRRCLCRAWRVAGNG